MDKKALIKKIIHEVCKEKGFKVKKIILFGSSTIIIPQKIFEERKNDVGHIVYYTLDEGVTL